MKKRNLILQSAIAITLGAAALGAQAGTLLSNSTNFAIQNFGPTAPGTLGITPAVQTYTYNTTGGIVLNPGGVINMYFRLASLATYGIAPVLADYSGSVVTGLGLTKTAVAVSTDKKTAVLTLTNGTTANIVIGVGATLTWTPSALSVQTVNTTLNVVGGTVTLQSSASVLPANANAAALPADVDNGVSNVTNIAVGATAITYASTPQGTVPAETQKIDVTVTPSQTKMTTGVNTGSTLVANFGSFTFTNVGGVKTPGGAVDYTIGGNLTAAGTGAVLTGNFAAAAAAGMKLTTDTACTTPLAAGGTAVVNGGATTATWAGATTAATAVPTFVCMTVTGTTVIPPTTPTLTVTTTPTLGTDAVVGGGPSIMYALNLNGASVAVRNYIPACSGGGYQSFVRTVNGGNAAAPISVAVISDTTGVLGPSSIMIPSLPAGAAMTLSSAQVEAATGAILPCTSRPRLLITSPTASLQVSNFFLQPDGNFNEVSGGQLSNPGPGGATAVVPTGN